MTLNPITLGKNKYSTVMKMQDQDGNIVARKFIFKPDCLSDDEFKKKVLREFFNLKKLSLLGNNNELLVAKSQAGVYAIDMKYIEGQPLSKLKFDTKEEALTIFQNILKKVKEIHDKGIIHNDLKPTNILCSDKKKYEIELIDFGEAFFSKKDILKSSSPIGTPGFMAPEVTQCSGMFGAILYNNEDMTDFLNEIIPTLKNKLENELENFSLENFFEISNKKNNSQDIEEMITDETIKYNKRYNCNIKCNDKIIKFIANFINIALLNDSIYFSEQKKSIGNQTLSSNNNEGPQQSNEEQLECQPLTGFPKVYIEEDTQEFSSSSLPELRSITPEERKNMSISQSQKSGLFSILSTRSDIYSIGKIFENLILSQHFKLDEFESIITEMTALNMQNRPSIDIILEKLNKIEFHQSNFNKTDLAQNYSFSISSGKELSSLLDEEISNKITSDKPYNKKR